MLIHLLSALFLGGASGLTLSTSSSSLNQTQGYNSTSSAPSTKPTSIEGVEVSASAAAVAPKGDAPKGLTVETIYVTRTATATIYRQVAQCACSPSSDTGFSNGLGANSSPGLVLPAGAQVVSSTSGAGQGTIIVYVYPQIQVQYSTQYEYITSTLGVGSVTTVLETKTLPVTVTETVTVTTTQNGGAAVSPVQLSTTRYANSSSTLSGSSFPTTPATSSTMATLTLSAASSLSIVDNGSGADDEGRDRSTSSGSNPAQTSFSSSAASSIVMSVPAEGPSDFPYTTSSSPAQTSTGLGMSTSSSQTASETVIPSGASSSTSTTAPTSTTLASVSTSIASTTSSSAAPTCTNIDTTKKYYIHTSNHINNNYLGYLQTSFPDDQGYYGNYAAAADSGALVVSIYGLTSDCRFSLYVENPIAFSQYPYFGFQSTPGNDFGNTLQTGLTVSTNFNNGPATTFIDQNSYSAGSGTTGTDSESTVWSSPDGTTLVAGWVTPTGSITTLQFFDYSNQLNVVVDADTFTEDYGGERLYLNLEATT